MKRFLLAVSALLFVSVIGTVVAGEPPAKKSKAETAAKVAELRAKYPIVSIRDRLAYEKRAAQSEPQQTVNADAATQQAAAKDDIDRFRAFDMRSRGLEMLHSERAEQFINREGFGVSRMPTPSVESLKLPAAPDLPFLTGGRPGRSTADEATVALDAKVPQQQGQVWYPSVDMLSKWNRSQSASFASSFTNGYVKDVDHVAGFLPHQFRYRPELRFERDDSSRKPVVGPPKRATDPPPEEWTVDRIELVSLLKHSEPGVYRASSLPRMDELKDAPVRPLDPFEKQALGVLRKGQDISVESTSGHIRMLGALRARSQCMQCHEVERGELLGAFSYALTPKAAAPVAKPVQKPAT